MVHTPAIAIAATALLAALPVNAGLYPKTSKVLQVDSKSFDRLIAQSNYTSIVEFYAPWCGHCKNLQPAYEKAAISLQGLAKVAAIDCDVETNKAFCGSMGVQGFPTLKIVKPGKTPGIPVVDPYDGPRTAKGIVDAVIDKIPNLVKRVDDKTLEAWLAESNDTAKAILFSDKGKTSALLKAIAIDFKGSINVAQIRNTDKEKASLELFGVDKFPTLLLLPGGKEAEGIVYGGELKKEPMVKFLTEASKVEPNQDPAPAKVKVKSSKKDKPKKDDKKAKEKSEAPSESQASAEGETDGPAATEETLVNDASESPSPEVEAEKPIVLPPRPIPMLTTDAELEAECLGPRTGTCILAIVPSKPDDIAAAAVDSLSNIAHRHKKLARKLLPLYALSETTPGYHKIKKSLGLGEDTQVIAINGRRGWWKKLPSGDSVTLEDVIEEKVENWVGAIQLGEGAKTKLPAGLIPEEVEEPAAVVEETPLDDGDVKTETSEGEAKPDIVEEVKVEEETVAPAGDEHDEL
ncbi:related to protein disulfide isomerase-related protein A [Rhynchosporium secalis]|uniref:protein disulfide-isomerase n=1 Tax=Rhynchosporium secalis TaxID=38038 RepID=A0A1E1MTL3_RHYSE|nr:related to protein disulfide isomerase-related protein A [Rhynchosporium secalis]